MSHSCLTSRDREALGITDDLIRLSIGIEDVEDILADLQQALEGSSEGAVIRVQEF